MYSSGVPNPFAKLGGITMVGPLIIVGLFLVLGVVFSAGKGSFLIAGFNTMPKEEKLKYDKGALSRFMGKVMFSLSFSMLLWMLGDVLEMELLFAVGVVLFIGILIFTIVYANTGNRFKK